MKMETDLLRLGEEKRQDLEELKREKDEFKHKCCALEKECHCLRELYEQLKRADKTTAICFTMMMLR